MNPEPDPKSRAKKPTEPAKTPQEKKGVAPDRPPVPSHPPGSDPVPLGNEADEPIAPDPSGAEDVAREQKGVRGVPVTPRSPDRRRP
jgi:hypothetical protein